MYSETSLWDELEDEDSFILYGMLPKDFVF